jgi:hypothetical protein
MAAATGMAQSAVSRIWRAFGEATSYAICTIDAKDALSHG